MSKHAEMELKLALPPQFRQQIENMPTLRQAASQAKDNTLISVYFDTPDFKLWDRDASLRIRSDGERHIQTVKVSRGASLTARDEYEAEVPSATPEFAAIKDTPLESALTNKRRHALKAIFETQIARKSLPLHIGKAHLLLAIDEGTIRAGGASEDVCEVEIELIDGEPSELFRLARALSEAAPLRLAGRSKSARGYDLVTGKIGAAVTAEDIALDGLMSSAEAFRIIAESCLSQVAANWEAVRASDVEGVHEMRVGLRRLRAAISIFSEMLRDDETVHIKNELKWLTDELGPARQLHVLLTEALDPIRKSSEENFDALENELMQRRLQAERRAVAAVDSVRFRNLLLETLSWIHTGAWGAPSDGRLHAMRCVRDFAPEALEALSTKIVKRGKKLATLDAARLHKLRIAAKKLRYGSEFFADLFPGARPKRRRKAFLANLKHLQDCLGALNDTTAHRALCADIGKAVTAHVNGCEIAYLVGIVSRQEEARSRVALASSEKVFKRFAAYTPFWD